MSDAVYIYTDGAASGNPGKGGYGVVLKFNGHYKEYSDGFRLTTNNRMELLAVIKGLELLKTNTHPVIITSDSKYVIDSIEKKWLDGWIKTNFKGDKKNPDLWIRLYKLLKEFSVRFVWVKGHAGHPENERCDELAVMASQNPKHIDEYYEKYASQKK